MPIAVDPRVQQVHSHEILRVGDRVQSRTDFSLSDVLIRDAGRGHDATVDGSTLVIAIRVEAGTRATQVRTPVVTIPIPGIHTRRMWRDVQVSILDVVTN